jgi:hypothetical protein
MLTTAFKDKIPKGISYPLPFGFLEEALHGAAEQAVALYFVHGSHWTDHESRQRLHMPLALLSAGRTRPMFRNNNQKVEVRAGNYDWHFVLWAMPSESRHVLQKEFESTAAQPLVRWLVDRKPRSSRVQVWWYPETGKVLMDFR